MVPFAALRDEVVEPDGGYLTQVRIFVVDDLNDQGEDVERASPDQNSHGLAGSSAVELRLNRLEKVVTNHEVKDGSDPDSELETEEDLISAVSSRVERGVTNGGGKGGTSESEQRTDPPGAPN